MAAAQDKAKLRADMRKRRRALKAALPAASREAADALPLSRLPAFASVGGYAPQGSEIDPWPLLQRLADTGAHLALPRADTLDGVLTFHLYDPDEPQLPDVAGVPSPPASAPIVRPDLVICPLLAFDREGRRLGQGGGHYDRTLAELRARKTVFVLGLAFSGQEVASLPADAHDQALDAILTETGYIAVAKR
jgi:5-formyltetrahydrofolate cyclo-ligase